jgi:type I restriction enzyme, S subunit
MNLVKLENFAVSKGGSVDPSKYPEEIFDLYSIPAYDQYTPDVIAGNDIGSAKKIVQPGDVLLSRIIPHTRRVWVVGPQQGRRQIGSGEWIVFRGDSFYPNYLRHILMADPFHQQFMKTVSGMGGSLLRARPSEVEKIKIPLPPLPEQKRIADILDKADSIRRKRQDAVRLTEELLRSVFLDMFGDPETNPKGINNFCLSEVTTRITDGTHLTPKFIDSGVPFIFVKNIKNGKIDFQTDKYISEEEHKKLYERCPVEEGDILYTTVGATYGQAVAVGSFTKFAFQRHVAHVKPDKCKVLSDYLGTIMQLPIVKNQADRWARGAAQPTVNLTELRDFVIPLPPLHLQREFAQKVAAVEKLKTVCRLPLEHAETLFNSLLQRAFKGDL